MLFCRCLCWRQLYTVMFQRRNPLCWKSSRATVAEIGWDQGRRRRKNAETSRGYQLMNDKIYLHKYWVFATSIHWDSGNKMLCPSVNLHDHKFDLPTSNYYAEVVERNLYIDRKKKRWMP
ncbi:uncharacterized protein LOC113355612 [Papaver somniferum]|uniref:uncharacterized protein LOC113355612 n=1 Tax=Papaver somniferum TaxID=3469 RepID=UPI000E6FC628|nr:uncharacterized protein LOC113355612 [Papaver somniferum]